MSKRNPFIYSRTIKLGPAIGDWTTVQYRDTDLEEINISSVQNINFDSLPRDQLRYVHYIHYRMAEQITKKMSLDMDIKVELHTIMATQISYEDFLISQQDKVVQSDFFIKEVGRVNVLLEWSLADMMVNRLTGGKGEAIGTDNFSNIEMSILKTQMDQVVPYFEKAWKFDSQQRDIALKTSFGNYQPDKKISLREAYILFTFYFFFGKDELKKMVFAYPNPVLRRLLYLRALEPDPLKPRIMLYPHTMRSIKVPLKVVLGQATLTMKELQHLQVGDVVMLDRLLTLPVDLCMGSKKLMKAQPGVVDNNLCVQLIRWDEEKHVSKPLQKSPITVTRLLEEDEMFVSEHPQAPLKENKESENAKKEEVLAVSQPLKSVLTNESDTPTGKAESDFWNVTPDEPAPPQPEPVAGQLQEEPSFDMSEIDPQPQSVQQGAVETHEEQHNDNLFDDVSFDPTHVAQQDQGVTEANPLDAFGDDHAAVEEHHEDEFSWDDLNDETEHHEEGH